MRQKKNIAIITARSGSKGLPDKNIKLLMGMPLIAYSIIAAQKSQCFHKIFVSTDSSTYAEIAMHYGADASFLRSEKTSSDTAGSWDVIREVIEEFVRRGETYDRIMLLQPTSPLRSPDDIKKSFQLMELKDANSIVSVTATDHSPLWCNTLPEDLSMEFFRDERYCDLPRQMLPTYYRVNGAIYLVTYSELYDSKMLRKKSYAYIMPQERSIDIDTEFDFTLAELILSKMENWI